MVNRRLHFFTITATVIVTLLFASTTFAQDTAAPAPGSLNWWVPILNLIGGVAVSYAVTFLKAVPFVQRNPKLVAAALAIVLSLIGSASGVLPEGVAPIIVAIVTQLSAAIGVHEVVTKPINAATGAGTTVPEPDSRI